MASLLLVLGSLGYSGLKFVEGAIASEQTEALAAQTRFYEQRYARARGELPKAPAEAHELAQVVETVEVIRARRASPIDMLNLVSQSLAGFPQIRIDEVAWKVSADPEEPVGGRGARPVSDQPSGSRARRDAQVDPGVVYELVLVAGRIDSFEGDFRGAIRTVHDFADALTAQPSIEHVRVLSLPLELDSTEQLRGATDAVSGPAEFAVRIALRRDVPASASAR